MLVRNIAIAILIMFVSTVQASQLDARLDDLFERLQASPNEWQIKLIENQIESVWMESDQEEINILMHRGVLALQMKEFSAALQIFDVMIQKAPNFAEAWNKRAITYYLMGNYEASVKDIQKTILLEPRHFKAMSGLGFIYTKLGQYEDALNTFQKIEEIHPHFEGLKYFVPDLKRAVNAHRI